MVKMQLTIALVCVLASALANAKTFYFVDGKMVASAGDAKKAALKNDKAVVVKIQATQVTLNGETLNLKKSADLELAAVKALIK
jgi:hypothetical protein